AASGVRVDEIPQPISHDGTAGRARNVVRLREWSRRGRTLLYQLRGQIVGLKLSSSRAYEERAAPQIAAAPRHDVHGEPAGFRLTESTGRLECDFLRLSEVDGV